MSRRALMLPLLAGMVLSLGGSAAALTHQGFQGSIGPGHLQLGATFSGKGKPKSVNRIEWSNVPATCPGPFQISDDLKLVMKVDGDGRFRGTGPAENNPNATVRVVGRFKNHNRRTAGTLRMYGAAAGCPDLDTGVVQWSAKRR